MIYGHELQDIANNISQAGMAAGLPVGLVVQSSTRTT